MELNFTLSHKQIMSQRMQLSVNILQMNALDLEQFIHDSSLENPLIELEIPPERDDPVQCRLNKLEWLDSIDDSNSYQYIVHTEDRDRPLYNKNATDSLNDILLSQLPGFKLPERAENRVRYLIDNMDENGYITMPREQLKKELDISDEQLSAAFDVLYRMDPPGVGAVDLRECLLLQARRRPNCSPILTELIEGHLGLLAKNQLAKIAKALHVSVEEVKKARDQLLTMNPKPGNGYSSYNEIPYIRPDMFVVRFGDSYQIILNDYHQPKIRINSYYRELAKDVDTETESYLSDKLEKAEWLRLCVQRRKDTILKCAVSILRRQIRFFEYGPGNLAPMTLADVSGDLDVHASTISRAVRGKYLQCQWGIFGLADFFSRSVSQADEGAGKSRDMIMLRIKQIINDENPSAPLSDQEITGLLRESGIDIARRTVAKYRERLGLAPSGVRKRPC